MSNYSFQEMKDLLVEFCDDIRAYELEADHKISTDQDDRETIEFVELFLKNRYGS